MSLPEPLVSVIVPVRDHVDGVREVVACLAKQTLPSGAFELVIGGDGAAPGPLEEVACDEWVRVANGPPMTSYAARNRAASVARGQILAFCDSDCRPEPSWLEEGLAALERSDIVAGEITFVPPVRPTIWSLLTADMFLDQERNVLLRRGVTANLFVRRRTFEHVGGFDVTLPSGGDYDFVRRCVEAGARLAYQPRAVVRHPTLDERDEFLRKVSTTNRWAAARRARAGEPLSLTSLLTLTPIVGVMQARRHALRPAFRLNRPRLVSSGIAPSWRHDVRAMSRLYFHVAYVAGFARIRGWRDGRGLRRMIGATDEPEAPSTRAADGGWPGDRGAAETPLPSQPTRAGAGSVQQSVRDGGGSG